MRIPHWQSGTTVALSGDFHMCLLACLSGSQGPLLSPCYLLHLETYLAESALATWLLSCPLQYVSYILKTILFFFFKAGELNTLFGLGFRRGDLGEWQAYERRWLGNTSFPFFSWIYYGSSAVSINLGKSWQNQQRRGETLLPVGHPGFMNFVQLVRTQGKEREWPCHCLFNILTCLRVINWLCDPPSSSEGMD